MVAAVMAAALLWYAVAARTGWDVAYAMAMVHLCVACSCAESLL